jgi:subtilisin family serine protease
MKRIIPFIFFITLFTPVMSQEVEEVDMTGRQWYFADPSKDKVPGISLEQAYQFLRHKQGKKVIVAILDSGIDTSHADIKGNFWVNPGEIPGNGIDDDGNGYIDDIHGWNFLGNQEGEVIAGETLEKTRIYRQFHPEFGSVRIANVPKDRMNDYKLYLRAKESYLKDVERCEKNIKSYNNILVEFYSVKAELEKYLRTKELTYEDVTNIKTKNEKVSAARSFYLLMYHIGITSETIEEWISSEQSILDTKLNIDNDPRHIAGDNPLDINDTIYGNNDLHATTPGHGTSVGGLVGAIRHNGFGIDGIASQVELMFVRVVPGGDERDKDVALGIRYAVNMGAQIINCSFGKEFSPERWMVDDAIRYAESRGVLIVHASGNDASDNDIEENYPTPFLSNGTRATNVIEVGSSTKERGPKLISTFSNYGKTTVDLFAPGSDIMTLKPGGYGSSSGTSLAAPVVTGVAALLLSYYPDLTPAEVRDILMKSVTPYGKKKVINPGTEKKVKMREMCVSGGVVNAYNAVKMAESRKQ